MSIERNNARLEEARLQLRTALNELLSNVDNITDYCYTANVAGIHIDIDIAPGGTIPEINIQTKIATNLYKDIAKSEE